MFMMNMDKDLVHCIGYSSKWFNINSINLHCGVLDILQFVLFMIHHQCPLFQPFILKTVKFKKQGFIETKLYGIKHVMEAVAERKDKY
jgi:hypothetical protein